MGPIQEMWDNFVPEHSDVPYELSHMQQLLILILTNHLESLINESNELYYFHQEIC